MPRFARVYAPGAVVHVIARFVNHQFRLAGPKERTAFLLRLPASLARADWSLLAYAMMSSHVHLALLAGHAPVWRWLKPLHTSMARWINRSQQTLGPVFAERAATVILPSERLGVLAAYLHNNPVRAGVVRTATESEWTSHRAWLGLDAAPPWLDVDKGLTLAGFDNTPAGRHAFDRFVVELSGAPRDAVLSGATSENRRRWVREHTRLPVELSSPVESRESSEGFHHVLYPAEHCPYPRWHGPIPELLAAISRKTGIDVLELSSRSRQPATVEARRLTLAAGVWLLGRTQKEIGAALGLSDSAASRALQAAGPLLPRAAEVAAELRTCNRWVCSSRLSFFSL